MSSVKASALRLLLGACLLLAGQSARAGDGKADAGAPTANSAQIEYEAHFSLGFDADADAKVLRLRVRYHNRGKTPVTFSTHAQLPFVRSLRAVGLRTQPSSIPCGRPAPPTAQDVIRIAPGATVERRSWYWADGTFPFTGPQQGDHHTLYLLPRKTDVQIRICQVLFADRAELAAWLAPDEALVTGTLCAAPSSFHYQVVGEP